MLDLKTLGHTAGRLVQDNVTTILTTGGVVGTVTTALLTGKAAVAASKAIDKKEIERRVDQDGHGGLDRREKFLIAAPHYIPPVIVGGATIGAIIAANRVSAKEAAALAAAYGVANGQLEEYKAKVAEKLTGPKNQAIKDEIAQDRVNANPPSKEVIVIASGEVLCHDTISGRYFHSTVEQIRKAEHYINAELANCQYASLSQFYDEIGLPTTALSETVGWNALNQDIPFQIELSTTTTPDQKPCIVLNYSFLPIPEFHRVY